MKESGSYSSQKTAAFVNNHKTSIEVLSLFDPNEISMKSKRDETISMDSLVMLVTVKDESHPVLKYFEKKAHLLYLGKEYEHNVFPEIPHDQIYKLEYHAYSIIFNAGLKDVLEVNVYGEEAMPINKTRYVSMNKDASYYDIDGIIYTKEEKEQKEIKFFVDKYSMKGVIFGKGAADKYGDPRYAVGVIIVRSTKDKSENKLLKQNKIDY